MSEMNKKLKRMLTVGRVSCAIVGFVIAGAIAQPGQQWLLPLGTVAGFLVGHLIMMLVSKIVEAKKDKE